jgi:two-component system chemotaxis response regulator CheY
MLLAKIFGNLGYEIIEAENGEEAVEMFNISKPDILIMDLNLPLLEGLDVMYKIRSKEDIKQPKIIFCSSNNDASKIREALSGGADDYIMKPFDEEIINSKLEILGLL